MYIGVFDVYLVLWGPHLGACVGFLSDPSPIIGYACQWLTHSVTPWRLVDLMAVNDANCLMMSQQLLEAVKSFFRLKKLV